MRRYDRLLIVLCFAVSSGCTTGEGSGAVMSDRLFVDNCWNGPFDLRPDFFGANPSQESMQVRVQRGDDIEELSDGRIGKLFLRAAAEAGVEGEIVLINDAAVIRGDVGPGLLGQSIPIGLPRGVAPPGIPLAEDAEPALVSMSLYLNATCHLQNGALYATRGSIVFDSLFSGDINESESQDRFTKATFVATFSDPRRTIPAADPAELDPLESEVEGRFSFFFQRGQPAQPCP